jgi:hypothetical protein
MASWPTFLLSLQLQLGTSQRDDGKMVSWPVSVKVTCLVDPLAEAPVFQNLLGDCLCHVLYQEAHSSHLSCQLCLLGPHHFP